MAGRNRSAINSFLLLTSTYAFAILSKNFRENQWEKKRIILPMLIMRNTIIYVTRCNYMFFHQLLNTESDGMNFAHYQNK